MNKTYYVYRHICPDGFTYVGMTTNPKRRWEAHGSNYLDQPIFADAIKKFGWDCIKHQIFYVTDNKQKAREKEKKVANYYTHFGFSLNAGDGHSHSPTIENRRKVSDARKKNTMSKETRMKIGEAVRRRPKMRYKLFHL